MSKVQQLVSPEATHPVHGRKETSTRIILLLLTLLHDSFVEVMELKKKGITSILATDHYVLSNE